MQHYITITDTQEISEQETATLLGGPATETIQSDGSTVLFGPETSDPVDSATQEAFHEGHIQGYGTRYVK